jgi:hypothetical protein
VYRSFSGCDLKGAGQLRKVVVQRLEGDAMVGCAQVPTMALVQDRCRARQHHKRLVQIAPCIQNHVHVFGMGCIAGNPIKKT